MKKMYRWYQTFNTPLKAVVIFLFTMLFVAIVFFTVSMQMNGQARRAMQPFVESDAMLARHIARLNKPAVLPESYFAVLKMQQAVMNKRKAHYLDLAFVFFRNYYGVLVVTMILSCTGGLILFILLNKGWATAGITLQACFLSLVFAVTFFGFFPKVFKQEENFTLNMASYAGFTNAEQNLVNQLSTMQSPLYGRRQVNGQFVMDPALLYHNLDSIVGHNTATINKLSDYILNMDANEVKSMSEIARLMSVAKGEGADSTGSR